MLADGPEAQQPDAELALEAGALPSAFRRRLIESQMCVATYLKSGKPFGIARHAVAVVLDRRGSARRARGRA